MKKNYIKLVAILPLVLLLTLCLHAQKPNIYFEPSTLEATLGTNDSAVVHSVLHNSSDYEVEFYFPGYTSRDQGGPDDFGYSWIDSEEAGGPDWSWSDIAETGILVEGLGDDQVAGPFETGFSFNFYGQVKNHFWISSNGVICFNDQFVPYVNDPIPTNSNYMDFIAWFWDDLAMDSALSRVYIQRYGEKTVIQFTKMVHFPGSESFITGQVILVNNGTIFLKYRIISEDFDKTSATAGIQSWNPESGLQVVYNAEYIHSELAVRFDLTRNFITSVSPSSLTLAPDTQETIWITYSSEGFGPGSYEQDLKCITSHPELPHLILHNVMHVSDEEQAGFKGYVTDAGTGFAINDVLVKVNDHQTYTNDNGFYELPLPQGEYEVKFMRNGYQTLIVDDTTALPGFSILDVELNGFYFIAGQVFAGDNIIESGFAYGYKMLEEEVVDIYAEMVGEMGWFEFSGLASAGYIVKAEPSPSSEYYGDFLPTYYGDVIHWEEATIINLPGSTDDAHIHLVAAVSAPTGPGSISGTIENSSRTAEVPIILRTNDPSAITMTLSATDGSFAFSDLAYGTYEIFAEIAGKSVVPMTVVLNEAHSSAENVDMMILGNEIVFLGIEESEVFESLPYIYPNPVSESAAIMINLKKPAPVHVIVLDSYGRTVSGSSYEVKGQGTLPLDLSGLASGIYLVKIEVGEELIVRRLIKN